MLLAFFNKWVATIKLNRMERCNMVEGYTILIMNGLATIDRVPARHKDAVLANLKALGLDGYGNRLPEESAPENNTVEGD